VSGLVREFDDQVGEEVGADGLGRRRTVPALLEVPGVEWAGSAGVRAR